MEKPETKGEKQDKAKMSTGMKRKWSSYYYDNGPELNKPIVDNRSIFSRKKRMAGWVLNKMASSDNGPELNKPIVDNRGINSGKNLMAGMLEMSCSVELSCSDNGPVLRQGILDNLMEALVGDPNTHLIGVHCSEGEIENKLLRVVRNRVYRDNLFDVVLRVSVTKKPDIKQIQDEIAGQMGFTFNEKSKGNRVNELVGKMKDIHRLLVILCDLHKGLDLGKLGIPFGEDHRGCKILLTSASEEVLSQQMHTHKNISV